MNKKNNVLVNGSNNFNLENWDVYHPNGKHMFTCSGKKAHWYLDRGLAIEIGNFQIQLTFEPSGDGFSDNEMFGHSIRKPICVVSGVNYDLQRHHIIPYCYRKHFPAKYKIKNHHDVVLINHDLHAKYEVEANKYKDILAQKYGIRSITEYNKLYLRLLKNFNRDKVLILGKISSLFNGYGKISDNIIKDNLKFVAKKTGLDYELLINCNYIQLMKLYQELNNEYIYEYNLFKQRHAQFYDHGWHLVQKLNTDKKIEEFVKLWRKHFIETMKPQYMPKGWSINFRHKTRF